MSADFTELYLFSLLIIIYDRKLYPFSCSEISQKDWDFCSGFHVLNKLKVKNKKRKKVYTSIIMIIIIPSFFFFSVNYTLITMKFKQPENIRRQEETRIHVFSEFFRSSYNYIILMYPYFIIDSAFFNFKIVSKTQIHKLNH